MPSLPVSEEAVEAAGRAQLARDQRLSEKPQTLEEISELVREGYLTDAREVIQAFLAAEGFDVEHQIEGDQHWWQWDSDNEDGGLGKLRAAHPEQAFIPRVRLVSPWKEA